MRLMARVAETFELGQVHRFAHEWERDASLRLRAGDVEVLDEYAAHGRIYGGTAEANEAPGRPPGPGRPSGRPASVHPGRHQRAGRPSGRPVPGRTGGLRAGRSRRGAPRRRQPGRGRGPDRAPESTTGPLTTSRGRFVTNRSVYQVAVPPPGRRLDRRRWSTRPPGSSTATTRSPSPPATWPTTWCSSTPAPPMPPRAAPGSCPTP